MRTVLHYIAALLLLSVYGGQVCPLIDTLELYHWGGLVAVSFCVILTARTLLIRRVVSSAPLYDQPSRQFMLEFGLFVAVGLSLTLFNTLHLGFPVHESGPKVIIGYMTFGYFIGLDLALARERYNGQNILRKGITPPDTIRYTSLTRRFSMFALVTVFMVGAILILAVIKDVYWLSEIDFATEGMRAQMLIMGEVGFIMFLLCAYTLNIIISYTRNIKLFFGNETRVLRQVQEGDLSARVPALTRDEFGEIAAHTNIMIEGLRERERVKSIFGKAVSPTIAKRLMEQEEKGVSLGGSMQFLVILFSDIRNFTTRTETNSPEAVIKDLNSWFAEAVEAINSHGGTVDKFIGDGILAVFGLDGDPHACRNAIKCAHEMQERLERLAPDLCEPMEVGIGIHKGEALAGIVGSPERLEFTVVGDVVNTAARIEGMSRELNASVLVSAEVLGDLSESAVADGWVDFGPQMLKGKAEPVRLFGVGRK